MSWIKFMPDTCPWCGSVDKPGRYGAGRCNNSWHPEHPEHSLAWPTFVWSPTEDRVAQ